MTISKQRVNREEVMFIFTANGINSKFKQQAHTTCLKKNKY